MPGGRISILGIYERRVNIDLNKEVLFQENPYLRDVKSVYNKDKLIHVDGKPV